jgi:nucleoside-diphosphate-sugar epimerase
MSADGVINCAFSNDFEKFAEGSEVEKRAIHVLGGALRGSSRPLVVTSGVALLAPGRIATEEDSRPVHSPVPRDPETSTLEFANQGVRAMLVRLSPVTHGNGDGGFAGLMSKVAREKRISAYVGSGENKWAAVHYRDAAILYRLALEKGTAGSAYHAVDEQGVTAKEIAQAIGDALAVPTVSLNDTEASQHFGWFKNLAILDTPASSNLTQAELGWKPTHMKLITDLKTNLKK